MMRDARSRSRAAERNAARRKRAKMPAPPVVLEMTSNEKASTGLEGDDSDEVERADVARDGAFGSYGRLTGGMSIEDDEWATSTRTWRALREVLAPNGWCHRGRKIWAPFVYDELAGKRMMEAGFERVVHKRADFFERVRDGPFVRTVSAVVDNPPYTGKGMKQKILRALVEADVPFCLLLPVGVLHGAFVRKILDERYVQAIIPRKCFVFKSPGGAEIPFKYLCWLCYKMELERDLYFID